MAGLLHDGLLGVALCGLAALAVIDFWTLKIRNPHVLAMLALALAVLALRGTGSVLPDTAAGLVLFALGFLFWLLGMMGAGDAKLYLPLGILIGWQGLVAFAVLLLPASVLVLAVLKTGPSWLPEGPVRARIDTLAQGRKVPYAIPMALAGMGAIAFRWL